MRLPQRLALAAMAALSFALPAAAADAIKSAVSTSAESNHVFCDGTGTSPVHKAPCFPRSVYITTGATAGYLMSVDAASAPAAGGAAIAPRDCIVAPANTTVSLDYGETSEPFTTGYVAVFSTTGCFTNTASSTAFFKGRFQ